MNNENIQKFMADNPPLKKRKETVRQKKDEIMTLHKEGYTFEQISAYIKQIYRLRTSRHLIGKIIKEEFDNECK